MQADELKRYIDFAYFAYQEHNVSGQAFRQGGKVPYLTHPVGSAFLLLADTVIPSEEREKGCKILILHDVLEDTSAKLPEWVDDEVKKGVVEMTYTEESDEEKMKKILEKSPFIKLLTLYDAFWSLYEQHVSEHHRKEWKAAVAQLAVEAEKNYGNARIVQIAKVVVDNTDW